MLTGATKAEEMGKTQAGSTMPALAAACGATDGRGWCRGRLHKPCACGWGTHRPLLQTRCCHPAAHQQAGCAQPAHHCHGRQEGVGQVRPRLGHGLRGEGRGGRVVEQCMSLLARMNRFPTLLLAGRTRVEQAVAQCCEQQGWADRCLSHCCPHVRQRDGGDLAAALGDGLAQGRGGGHGEVGGHTGGRAWADKGHGGAAAAAGRRSGRRGWECGRWDGGWG